MLITDSIAVVLGVSTVTDYENLYVLEKTASSPEAVVLVSIDLVERFANINTTALELNVNQRQAIHENSNVEAILASTFNFILVEDLNAVVVNVLFVDQVDVLAIAIVPPENADVIFLEATGLLNNPVLLTRDALRKKAFPLSV